MARTTFLTDTFTEAADTALESHTADSGQSWAKQFGFTNGMTVIGAEDRATGDAAGTSLYRCAASPSTANYSVKATLRHTTTGTTEGITARAASGAGDFYHAYYDSSGPYLRFFRNAGGAVATDLGTYSVSIGNATDYTLEIVVFDVGAILLYNDVVVLQYVELASPLTAAGAPGVRCRQNGRVDNLSATYDDTQSSVGTIYEVQANGIWTWFSEPRAVYYNGATYFGWVNKSGDVGVTKWVHATRTATSFTLSSALEADDHDDASIYITPTGYIVCFYSKHNDTVTRYRRSTNPEDVSAFSAESTLATVLANSSYANPIALNGRLYMFHRSKNGVDTIMAYRRYTNDEVTGGSWDAAVTFFTNSSSGDTPYFKYIKGSGSVVEIVYTNRHPVDGQSSIYHMRMVDTAGTVTWKKTDGTSIATALPLTYTDGTLVSDGTTVKRWIWDIAIDGSGYPQILGTRYPGNNGTTGSPAPIVYIHCLWNGSAWSEVDVANDDVGFYSPEVYYAGGIAFDSADITKAYVSRPTSAGKTRKVMVYTYSGGTWSYVRDIISDPQCRMARPVSPRNHNGQLAVLWWSGVYDSFGPASGSGRGYTTRIQGEYVAPAVSTGGATSPSPNILNMMRRRKVA